MSDFKLDQDLISAIANDKLIIFVGAGLSKGFNLPTWKELVENILTELSKDDNFYKKLKSTLDDEILNEIEVLEKIQEHNPSTKSKIYRKLESTVDIDLSENDLTLHKSLGEISSNIITTNYDKLLETALPNFKKISNDEFHLANFHDYNKSIFKIHGSIEKPTECVLFKKDYDQLYQEDNPSFNRFKSIIADKSVLFIGFGFEDPYVQATFKYIKDLYSDLNKKHFIVTTKDNDFSDYGLSSVIIDSWAQLPSLINTLKTKKRGELEQTDQALSLKKVTKVGILYSNPLDVNDFYDINKIIKHFSKYEIHIQLCRLSIENLNDLEDIDYLFAFTTTLKNMLVLEDNYLKTTLVSIKEFEEYLYLPNVQGIFIFIKNESELKLSNDVHLPILVMKYHDDLNNILFKMFKKANIDLLPNIFSLNKNKISLHPLSKGKPTFIRDDAKNISEKIDKKNLMNFVGRKTDILDVVRKIKDADGRIITLKGSGGIGKTTLIKKIALEFTERNYYKEGIGFVECEFIKDYGTFEKSIARCFNLDISFNFIEAIKEYKKLELLIILDNFETILELDDKEKIKDLVTFVSDFATIVVTSRQWIGFDYEEKHELRNFTTNEAFLLFKKNYHSKISNKDEKLLKEDILENMLNNNPLAIKIITKNLPNSSNFEALKQELREDFFRTTNTGDIDIYDSTTDENIERSESLYQSINYSYVRLNNKEKLVFEILSLFPNGIHLEAFKSFFKTEEFKKDLFKITNRELKSLEDKSLIEISGGFINLQSIIGRFADAKFNNRVRLEKNKYYQRAFEFNSYVLSVIEDINLTNQVKALRIVDSTEENFIKSMEYLPYVVKDTGKLLLYIIRLGEYFTRIGQSRKFARNLNKSEEIFKKELNGHLLMESLYFSSMYFDGEFSNSFEYIKNNLSLERIRNIEVETKELIKSHIIIEILIIYCLEGFQYEVLVYLKENEFHSLYVDEMLFALGHYSLVNMEGEMKEDFFYYDYLYNIGEVEISEIDDYLKNRVYNKEYIEIVQTNYVKTKLGFNTKKDIEPLVVTNPFTVGLKNLMLAIVEDTQENKVSYFERQFTILHI
ncbi:SIR2 family protein [Rossellomorea marisflavi]|uniref:SIR2 family protein n=1 Tax=Rossellomorea marisflavi TaxID=189381 RepID=UPI003457AFD4